jgi:isopenicillin N synthase-like dioxygenase
MAGENLWPASPPGFQKVIANYYGEVLRLARRLIRVLAQCLDLPADYFDSMVSRPGAMGNILHYPPQEPTADRIGINAHSDFECFTILAQSSQSGLQILNRKGEWITAPPIPGTFVVNIGDMLERWSNDIFVSTVHRVINTTGEERYSIPVFFGPNYDTVVEPLKTCIAEGQKAKYEPILAGDYVYARLDEVYRKRQTATEGQAAPEVTVH